MDPKLCGGKVSPRSNPISPSPSVKSTLSLQKVLVSNRSKESISVADTKVSSGSFGKSGVSKQEIVHTDAAATRRSDLNFIPL